MTEQSTENTTKQQAPTDIFLWANQTDSSKDQLEIDLFLFTKGFTVYATKYSDTLKQQLKVLFLYDMISGVQTGAATGLVVRELENVDRDDNVLLHVTLDKVEHAQEVIEQIAYGEESLEIFNENDHEFKKIKGIVARCQAKGKESTPFYVIKLLSQSQVLKGESAWMFNDASFQPFSAEAGLRVTPDNQVMIASEDIFVFSESKFERLFGYSAKKFAVADEKIREIEQNFKLKLPDGLTLSDLARDNKTLVNKLQKVDPSITTQEKLLDHADDMELELMADETAGEIIIMDARDAAKFIDLLSDDYLTSGMTGIKYLAKSKKPLHDAGKSNANDPLIALAERDV